jgi:hypothetical protein
VARLLARDGARDLDALSAACGAERRWASPTLAASPCRRNALALF